MPQHEISFDCTTAERERAMKIATRAFALRQEANMGKGRWAHRSAVDITMDLIATHANGCPLDFARLYEADDFNLSHDVFGIERHLDRETGQLRDFFSPRCSRKVPA